MSTGQSGLSSDKEEIRRRGYCAGCGKKFIPYEGKIKPRQSVNPDGNWYHYDCEPEEMQK